MRCWYRKTCYNLYTTARGSKRRSFHFLPKSFDIILNIMLVTPAAFIILARKAPKVPMGVCITPFCTTRSRERGGECQSSSRADSDAERGTSDF
jgi:hypothetical protein